LTAAAAPTKNSASPTPAVRRRIIRTGIEVTTFVSAIETATIADPTTISGRRPRRSPARPANGRRSTAARLNTPPEIPTATSVPLSGPSMNRGIVGSNIPTHKKYANVETTTRTKGAVTSGGRSFERVIVAGERYRPESYSSPVYEARNGTPALCDKMPGEAL
jgi:hypothetical protein